MARLPLAWIGVLARVASTLAGMRRRHREAGRIRVEAVHLAWGVDAPQARYLPILERLLDLRMYHMTPARRARAWPGLAEVVAELAMRIGDIRRLQPGRPIVLAPFHYISQYVNIHVCEELRKALSMPSLAVVSGVPSDMWGNDADHVPRLRVLHTAEDDSRRTMGLAVFRAMKQDGLVVIFADIPPFALFGSPRETVAVRMAGRPARVHNGAFRLGKPLDAVMLPFFLRYEGERMRGQVLDSIELARPQAAQAFADTVQQALRCNPAQWLYLDHPSFYGFSPER